MERFSGWLNQPVPRHHVPSFARKMQTVTRENMADSVLLLLELFDDSEVEYDEILSGDDQLFFTE